MVCTAGFRHGKQTAGPIAAQASTWTSLSKEMLMARLVLQATAAAAFEGRAVPDEAAQGLQQLHERFTVWQTRVEALAAKVAFHH